MSEASRQWNKLTAGFIEEYFRAQPAFAAQSGRHEFDGQLPDFSNHGLRREIARLHDAHTNWPVDPKTLSRANASDREYLLTVVDKDLFWLERRNSP